VIRGLELVALGKHASFEIEYVDGGYRRADSGAEVPDLLDMTCYACGTAYYTTSGDAVEFCPHCGNFERRRFESFIDLTHWAREQDWGFLKHVPGFQVFGVLKDRAWTIKLSRTREELEVRGAWADVKPLQTTRGGS
jgi:predicted RNA-binding Zn-ribbon protein involved in translation (DUF1610 family)